MELQLYLNSVRSRLGTGEGGVGKIIVLYNQCSCDRPNELIETDKNRLDYSLISVDQRKFVVHVHGDVIRNYNDNSFMSDLLSIFDKRRRSRQRDIEMTFGLLDSTVLFTDTDTSAVLTYGGTKEASFNATSHILVYHRPTTIKCCSVAFQTRF